MLDFEGNFPGGSDFGPNGERTYVVSAVSRAGPRGPGVERGGGHAAVGARR